MKCDHSHILKEGIGLKCYSCGKTWEWNGLLNYYSDSFVGVFRPPPEYNKNKECNPWEGLIRVIIKDG